MIDREAMLASLARSLSQRSDISVEDLLRLDEPAVLFEMQFDDADGEKTWAYTVAGWLDGRNIATADGGCLIGGQCILVSAKTRPEADEIASAGLADTIRLIAAEEFAKSIAQARPGLADLRANPGLLRAALLNGGERRPLTQPDNAGIVAIAGAREKSRH
jgi:hypothetical protein